MEEKKKVPSPAESEHPPLLDVSGTIKYLSTVTSNATYALMLVAVVLIGCAFIAAFTFIGCAIGFVLVPPLLGLDPVRPWLFFTACVSIIALFWALFWDANILNQMRGKVPAAAGSHYREKIYNRQRASYLFMVLLFNAITVGAYLLFIRVFEAGRYLQITLIDFLIGILAMLLVTMTTWVFDAQGVYFLYRIRIFVIRRIRDLLNQ